MSVPPSAPVRRSRAPRTARRRSARRRRRRSGRCPCHRVRVPELGPPLGGRQQRVAPEREAARDAQRRGEVRRVGDLGRRSGRGSPKSSVSSKIWVSVTVTHWPDPLACWLPVAERLTTMHSWAATDASGTTPMASASATLRTRTRTDSLPWTDWRDRRVRDEGSLRGARVPPSWDRCPDPCPDSPAAVERRRASARGRPRRPAPPRAPARSPRPGRGPGASRRCSTRGCARSWATGTSVDGDLGVRPAAGDQLEDLALALGQLGERRGSGRRRRPGEEVHQPPGHARAEDRIAGRHRSDGPDQLGPLGALEQVPAGAGADRREHRLVVVVHRQHEDRDVGRARRRSGGSPRCRRGRAC